MFQARHTIIILLQLIGTLHATSKITEAIRGPRLTWFGLPVNQGSTLPLQPGRSEVAVICWNYGKRKTMNDNDFRLVMNVFNETGFEVKKVDTMMTHFRETTEHDRQVIRHLPDNLSACHTAVFVLPEDLEVEDAFDYQMILQKAVPGTNSWKSYSSALTLKRGVALRVSKGKVKTVIRFMKKHPQIMVGFGASMAVSNGFYHNYPLVAVGLVIASIGLYEILAGPQLTWYGMPTEFSNIKPFTEFRLSSVVICWNRRLERKTPLRSETHHISLQPIRSGKPSISYSLKSEFNPATEAIRDQFAELPEDLSHCYHVTMKFDHISLTDDTRYEMYLVTRDRKGRDHILDTFSLKPGGLVKTEHFASRLGGMTAEAAIAAGPAMLAIGIPNANVPLIVAGLVVTGASILLHRAKVHGSSFIGEYLSWHGLPNAEDQTFWTPESDVKLAVCWKKDVPNFRESQFHFLIKEKGKKLAALPARFEELNPNDKEYFKDIKNGDLCRKARFKWPKVDIKNNRFYELHLRGISGRSRLRYDSITFSGKKVPRSIKHTALEAAHALSKGGATVALYGIKNLEPVQISVGIVAIGLNYILTHNEIEETAETVPSGGMEAAVIFTA